LRDEQAASARLASDLLIAHSRIEQLHTIGQALTRFEGVVETMSVVVTLLKTTVPLRSLALLLDLPNGPTRTHATVWNLDEGADRSELLVARANGPYSALLGLDPRRAIQTETVARPPRVARTEFPLAATSETSGTLMLLPLVVAKSPIFGALQLESTAPLQERTLTFLNAVVNQLAVAIDRDAVVRARQAETEKRTALAVREAESAERASERARFLSDAGALFASSLDYRKTLDAAARAAVPLLADAAFIDEITEEGEVHRMGVVFADPKKQHLTERILHFAPRADLPTPPSQVLATGKSVLVSNISDLATIAQKESHAELLAEVGVHSVISVPLLVGGRILGALTLSAANPGRHYGAEDLTLAEEFARRAALAIDHARLYEKAQQAIRDRQDLLAFVSHDLKNPLTTVLVNSSVLLQALPNDDASAATRRRIGGIQRAGCSMRRIIDDLLDVASLEAGQLAVDKQPCPLEEIVREAMARGEAQANEKKVGLTIQLPTESMVLSCDRERILQVLGNLLGNAIKFTPEGGHVELIAEPRKSEAVFTVTDSGIGIRADELPRVFDRYWQARKTGRQGTGLGLSITKGLVEAHGGRIHVTSEPGRGATFTFTIPIEGGTTPT
jgi:signal transduction histidine kinase